ncbi:MAG: hypothetical protein ACREQ2_27965 [Candidatus Binatia bacterium]
MSIANSRNTRRNFCRRRVFGDALVASDFSVATISQQFNSLLKCAQKAARENRLARWRGKKIDVADRETLLLQIAEMDRELWRHRA